MKYNEIGGVKENMCVVSMRKAKYYFSLFVHIYGIDNTYT